MGVNWQSFNIAKNETVNFHQPSASAVALNRITGNSASAIYGALNANGKVFLINPNGVLFGKGASVNVGGIVASTKDITDANFIAGKYKFAGDSTAAILNQGNIKAAEGGYVAMLANNVTNEGTITANKGSVALGAGNAFTLSTDGTGKVNLAVDTAAVNAAAVNSGTIKADGGYVVMSASDAATVVNSVVTNTGVIQAQSLKNDNGTIVLDGGSQGIVNVGGTLDTSAAEADTAGGTIKVNGLYTNVNADAQLTAKATGTQTGGTIETSGDYLHISPDAVISASSESGRGGTWLLDPLYVTITNTLPSGKTWDNTFSYNNNSDSAVTTYVQADLISKTLTAGTGVTVVATDKNYVADILVESPITRSKGSTDAVTLTLKAQREVRIDADIKSDKDAGALNITLWSDSDATKNKTTNIYESDKSGAVILNADLYSNGGNINFLNGPDDGTATAGQQGTVGTYIGLKDSELKALISSDTRTDRNITTLGGAVNIYGDLLLATGDYTNIDTVATDGIHGGDVYVSGKIDSGNYYKAIDIGSSSYVLTWEKARVLAHTNQQGTVTEGLSSLWDSYLANITSNLENSVIESTVNKKDMYTAYFIGAYTKGNTSNTRTWYWADGPEAGKTFYNQTAGKGAADPHGNHTGTDYDYDNWHSGEPNNDGGQTIATIGYGWDSKWDDNKSNKNTASKIEIPGYIQETNMLRTALKINAGTGDVYLKGDIGSQRTLWELDVTNTGNVRTGGSVQLSDDYYQGKQFYSDMNIHTTGNVEMDGFVDATGNINIGYDKDGNAVNPGNVTAGSTLTAENGAVVIGSAAKRAASASLGGKVTAGTGVSIYTNGDVTANGIEAKGNDVSAIATGGTKPAMSTPKVLGDIDINDSKTDSIITLNGDTLVDSTDNSKDDITLFGDKMALNGPVTTNSNTGVVTVSNYTLGNTIDLGSTVDTTAGTLELSDTEIDKITASKLVVGNNANDTATKNINITAPITPKNVSVVHMYTGVKDGQIYEDTAGTGTLAPGDSGVLKLAITANTKVSLDNANNITTFADASSGDTTNDTIRLNNGTNTLTIGTVDGVTGVTTDATNNKDAVILATENQTTGFVNDVGSNGISVPTTSNWRVFSYSPAVDAFGPGDTGTYLKSDSYADWNTTYEQGDNVGSNVIKSVTTPNKDDEDNHYIFAVPKTLVLTPIDTSKTYGTDLTTSYTKGIPGTNYTILGSIYEQNIANDITEVEKEISSVTLKSDGLKQTANVGVYNDLALTVYYNGKPIDQTTNGYLIGFRTGKVTVTPIPLTIDVNATRTYGATKSGNTFADATYAVDNSTTAQANGLKSWDADKYTTQVSGAATYVDNTLATTNVGTYNSSTGKYLSLADALKSAAVLQNYTVTYKDSYTINKAPLVINLSGTRTYGDTKNTSTNLFDTATYKVDDGITAQSNGLKSWDITSYNSAIAAKAGKIADNTTATTDAKTSYTSTNGTYLTLSDTAKAVAFLKNYDVSYDDTYTINPVALDVTITGTREYGDPSSTNGADYTAAATDATQLKNGETIGSTASGLTMINTVGIGANVGTYYNDFISKTGTTTTTENASVAGGALLGSNGFNANNYTITYHTQYDVTPAPLTIKADSKTMQQGSVVPPLTSTYAGFKNGDTAAAIDDTGLFTTGTSLSPKGSYPIDFSGTPNNPNYTITLIPGTLTITPVADPHTNPIPPSPPTNPTNPTTPSNPSDNGDTKIPDVPKVQEPVVPGVNNNGSDDGWGLDRIQTKESMPVYLISGGKATREGAYDVSDDKTGVKMHPTTNIVSDPQDDATEKRTATVQYKQGNATGTFQIIFDGSIVKVLPMDAAAKQMVTSNEGTRYVSIYRGALDTALNDMGVILDSIRAVYLVV